MLAAMQEKERELPQKEISQSCAPIPKGRGSVTAKKKRDGPVFLRRTFGIAKKIVPKICGRTPGV